MLRSSMLLVGFREFGDLPRGTCKTSSKRCLTSCRRQLALAVRESQTPVTRDITLTCDCNLLLRLLYDRSGHLPVFSSTHDNGKKISLTFNKKYTLKHQKVHFTLRLHAMQRTVLRPSFCPSLRPSVKRVHCDKTKKNLCPHSYTI